MGVDFAVCDDSTANGDSLEAGVRAAIALGSNLGQSQYTLERSLETLNQHPGIRVQARSSWYQTKAVGPPQPDYINGCALLHVQLSAQDLLMALLQVEIDLGRVRRERWGPRTIDLDLLLYGDQVLNTPDLQIPHPRMTERAFVLVPLAEIAADWTEPVSGKTIADLKQALDCSEIKRVEGSR